MLSKKNLDSIPFLDLLDDGEDRLQKIHRTQSYVMEKIHRHTVDDMDFLEFERSHSLKERSEVERRSIADSNATVEDSLEDLRPPSRASNPQVFDREFVKMDHEVSLFRRIKDKEVSQNKKRVLEWL